MANSTATFALPPLPAYTLTPREPLLPPLPDNILVLIVPIIAYWVVSMIFHFFDVNDYFSQYRLHTPEELLKRNHVTRREVVRDVIVQQIIQTIAGLAVAYFDEVECVGREEYDIAAWAQRIRIAQQGLPRFLSLFGIDSVQLAGKLSAYPLAAAAISGGKYSFLTQSVMSGSGIASIGPAFARWELVLASAIYWYIIPIMQFTFCVFFLDTWQYFLHRAMHMNRWLYTTFHSRHHRLYVPYAFGALYNHPVEGFLLDTAGSGLGFLMTGMTSRQGMWYFSLSIIKTIDDHCGYAFPFDPLQHITSNNALYHDIHHQSWGIKSNFSQPFFTFWDRLLDTRWKGGDVSARYERSRLAAQRKVEADAASEAEVPENQVSKASARASKDQDDRNARIIRPLNVRKATNPFTAQTEGLKNAHRLNGSIRQK